MAGSDVSLYFNLLARDRASGTIAKSANTVRMANISAAASTVALGAAMASAGAWAISLGAAVSASIGSIPAIVAGAAASIIGLKLATGGLGAAWKALGQASSSGGGSAASTARQVAAAQREVVSASEALARANKQLTSAQQALNDSQEVAVKNLRDLTLNLAGAQLDEQQAVLSLADARQALAQARASGDSQQIARATLGYKQAELAILQAQARTDDLTESQQKAAAAGIAGSDAVTSAQEQYLQATQAVADATQRLADAQANLKSAGGGGGGAASAAATAMAALAPNARAVVTQLKQLAPAWKAVQQGVQQATFAGVAGDLRNLSAAILPSVTSQMKRMGGSFNTAIRQVLQLGTSSKGVSAINTILDATNQAVAKVAASLAPFVEGFLTLGSAGSQILPQIAGWVQELAVDFRNWANEAEKSGRLAAWLAQGRDALQSLWTIARNVLGIIGAIFKGGAADAGVGFLQRIADMTTHLRDFLNSTKGQDEIKRVLGDLRDIFSGIADVLPAVAGHAGEFTDTLTIAKPVLHEVAQHADELAKALPFLAIGYGLARAAAFLDLGVQLARIPTMWAHAAAMRALSREMKLARIAQEEQTAATLEGDLVQKRSIISMIASKIATVAQAVASGIATAAQWLWNIAMSLNPVGLIIIAIIALIAIFVLLWTKCSWFRDFWIAVWHIIADAALWVWHNVLEPYVAFVTAAFLWIWQVVSSFAALWWYIFKNTIGAVAMWLWHEVIERVIAGVKWQFDFIMGVVHKVGDTFSSVFSTIGGFVSDAFKSAINFAKAGINELIRLINKAVGFINHDVVDAANKIPGVNFPHIPTIPELYTGGVITRAGTALVGERGPELVSLPAGAEVHRNGTGPSGGTAKVEITLRGDGVLGPLLNLIRAEVRAQGGDLAVLGLKSVTA
jgi:hypothetical protein